MQNDTHSKSSEVAILASAIQSIIVGAEGASAFDGVTRFKGGNNERISRLGIRFAAR
ncbi:hypothetical protein [Rhizobium leguminosarum]|uniref:hypothetical protein n=1 Tax=Rhizobium leguminosarum TaxID=384 RepID=UPI0002D44353|nr:hypothetical protein [Rhizobium leguminosarum]